MNLILFCYRPFLDWLLIGYEVKHLFATTPPAGRTF